MTRMTSEDIRFDKSFERCAVRDQPMQKLGVRSSFNENHSMKSGLAVRFLVLQEHVQKRLKLWSHLFCRYVICVHKRVETLDRFLDLESVRWLE